MKAFQDHESTMIYDSTFFQKVFQLHKTYCSVLDCYIRVQKLKDLSGCSCNSDVNLD